MKFLRGALAFSAGLVIVATEFAAVRLMAPSFGQTTWIWANVIGVILIALTLGYLLGGRIAVRTTTLRPLGVSYLIAAAWIVAAVLLGPRLCNALLPTELPTDRVLPMAYGPSILACLLLFAVPVMLAATTSPILIQRDARDHSEGSSAGWIYALGTLGSLVGCYLAPLYLLPWWGTRRTCFSLAGVLAFLALVTFFGSKKNLGKKITSGSPSGDEDGKGPDSSRRPSRSWFVVALVAGFAITLVEFASIRLMSPWVGQSNIVWANVIGVCLLSISLGSHIGGRWIDARVTPRPFARALAGAAIWLVVALFATPTLLEILVPSSLSNSYVLGVSLWGSLAAALILFAPPLVVAGMAVPVVIRVATSRGAAGATAGRVFAWNTVGGLIGCFLTAPLLVPLLGSRGCVALAASMLAICSWFILTRNSTTQGAGVESTGRNGLFASLPTCLALAALTTVMIRSAPLLQTEGQLEERESAYQTIRAVEQVQPVVVPVGAPASWQTDIKLPMRFLRHDEDHETYQSAWLKGAHDKNLTGARYFEHMALGAQFVFPTRKDKRLDVLIIGHAGGTVYRVLRDTCPAQLKLHCVAVELDPGVVDMARAHLDHKSLEDERLTLITGEDGRTVVNALPATSKFDLVLIDAYTRTNYVPFQLASKEFFEGVQAHMKPGGWLGLNVLGKGAKSPVARAVSATANQAMGGAYLTPNPYFPGNVIIWASNGVPHGPRVSGDRVLHPLLRDAAFALERLTWRFHPMPNERILTDDRSPAEQMADEEFGL